MDIVELEGAELTVELASVKLAKLTGAKLAVELTPSPEGHPFSERHPSTEGHLGGLLQPTSLTTVRGTGVAAVAAQGPSG